VTLVGFSVCIWIIFVKDDSKDKIKGCNGIHGAAGNEISRCDLFFDFIVYSFVKISILFCAIHNAEITF
jgi:hypothetical protein